MILDNGRMLIAICNRTESTVGKGENAGYCYFLHLTQCL